MPFALAPSRTVQGLTLVTAWLVPLVLAGCTRPRPPVGATTTTRPPATTGRPVLLVGGTLQALSVINESRSYLTARGYRTYSMTLEGSLIGVNASSTES